MTEALVSLNYSGITPAAGNWIGVWRYEDGPGTKADGPWNLRKPALPILGNT